MKLRFACGFSLIFSLAAQTATDIPYLRKQGTATQLIVDGKPFLALSGELGNNTATSLENMQPIWQRLMAGNLNSVLAAVSWAKWNPKRPVRFHPGGRGDPGGPKTICESSSCGLEAGRTAFELPSGLGEGRYQRFARVKTKGRPSIETLSTLSAANRDADSRAFAALMRHIKAVDAEHTVIMMQVENEVGVLGDSRDRGEAANKAFDSAVPKALLDYMASHRDILHPDLRKAWEAAGSKTSGTWEQVFGKGTYTDGFSWPGTMRTMSATWRRRARPNMRYPMYVNTCAR